MPRFTKQQPAERYAYEMQGDQLDGYVLGSNTLGTVLGQSGSGKFLKVATPTESVTFNLTHASLSAGTALYAEHDGKVYIIALSTAGDQLERFVIAPGDSRLAHDVASERSFGKKQQQQQKKKRSSK